MRCLVINLDRSSDRLAHMQRIFEPLNLSFERVPATDGAQLPQETIDRVGARNRFPRPMLRAEVGCFQSHLACWSAIASGADPYGAVFEDDVLIARTAASLLRSWDWIPPQTDFIKLETRNRPVIVGWKSLRVTPRYKLARLLSFHDGLGGYIISRMCAQKLVVFSEQHAAPVDQLVLNPQFGLFGTFAAFQIMPAVCIQNALADVGADIPSTIDPDGAVYRSDHAQLHAVRNESSAAREIDRFFGSLRRVLRGQLRVRVRFG